MIRASKAKIVGNKLLKGRPHMKFVLVNGRTPRPESFCALCCEPIGESYLRELTTRLLRSHVLRRPLRARGLNTHGTREGIMTTIQDTNRPVRAAVRPRQVCDHCGGSFGMVTHRWWGRKFCRRGGKEAYLREIRLDRDTVHRLCGLLGVTSRSRQACSSST